MIPGNVSTNVVITSNDREMLNLDLWEDTKLGLAAGHYSLTQLCEFVLPTMAETLRSNGETSAEALNALLTMDEFDNLHKSATDKQRLETSLEFDKKCNEETSATNPNSQIASHSTKLNFSLGETHQVMARLFEAQMANPKYLREPKQQVQEALELSRQLALAEQH